MCSFCRKTFRSLEALNQHSRFLCRRRDKNLLDLAKRREKGKKSSESKENVKPPSTHTAYACFFCEETFEELGRWYSHEAQCERVHFYPTGNVSGDRKPTNKVNLTSKKESSLLQKNYGCAFCLGTFKSRYDLIVHGKSCSASFEIPSADQGVSQELPDLSSQFVCIHCGRTFPVMIHLASHERTCHKAQLRIRGLQNMSCSTV